MRDAQAWRIKKQAKHSLGWLVGRRPIAGNMGASIASTSIHGVDVVDRLARSIT